MLPIISQNNSIEDMVINIINPTMFIVIINLLLNFFLLNISTKHVNTLPPSKAGNGIMLKKNNEMLIMENSMNKYSGSMLNIVIISLYAPTTPVNDSTNSLGLDIEPKCSTVDSIIDLLAITVFSPATLKLSIKSINEKLDSRAVANILSANSIINAYNTFDNGPAKLTNSRFHGFDL